MKRYVLAVDIGNTNTVFGLFEDNNDKNDYEIQKHWRTVTRRDRTSDELGIFLLGFLQSSGIDPAAIQGFIYSSVVPSFNPIVERMASDYFRSLAFRVRHDNIPLTIDYPRPEEIGADRLVNAVAGKTIYPGSQIIVDLGTATTFCIVNDGHYIGGSIAPGLKLSMEALFRNTAQLFPVEFSRPPCGVVADSTRHAIQSGFFFGWVGLLRGILSEIHKAYPNQKYQNIATGGLAAMIHREIPELFDTVDPMLTLRGLKIIYKAGKSGGSISH
ncbi:MAG: type III pantothenate kinase [Leptospirales bacterium]|nr:type III pantothenate kinase [Leptospirales bacterium]